MTEISYDGYYRHPSVTIRTNGKILSEIPVNVLTAVGDADIDSALSRAMETPGMFVPVSSKSYARGVVPKNYAVRF